MNEQQPEQSNKNNKVVFISASIAFGMLLFVFVGLVPMYNLICDLTGLTGNTGEKVEVINTAVDESRTIEVQFLANNNESMPWVFKPESSVVNVHPGELTTVYFYAKNPTKNNMVAQAIPSLSPFEQTDYFHKTECFCFQEQPLMAGEEARMGLSFQVDLDLPAYVETLTLNYTLFDITQRVVTQ